MTADTQENTTETQGETNTVESTPVAETTVSADASAAGEVLASGATDESEVKADAGEPEKEPTVGDNLHSAVTSTGEAFKTAIGDAKESIKAKGSLTEELEADFEAVKNYIEEVISKIKAHL